MTLKNSIIHGSFWLIIRENINLVTRTTGLFILTRFIGPEYFGLYAAGMGIVSFVTITSKLGANIYIVRYTGNELNNTLDVLFTFFLLFSFILIFVFVFLSPTFSSFTKLSGFTVVIQVLFLTLPFTLCGLIPMGLIERSLSFKAISFVEMISQFIYYLISIPMAIFKFNVWAPVAGHTAMVIFSCLATFYAAGYTPRIAFNNKIIAEFLKFGIGYSTSSMAWQLRSLINPFIIAPLAGAETIGIIALATRIAESLDLFREATRRVSISALSKMQENLELLRKTISKGITYQVIAFGPIVTLFVVFSQYIIPLILGHKWNIIIKILPFVAFNVFCNAFGTVQTSALHVMNKNFMVTITHLIQNVILAGAAWLLLPKFGIIGYGYSLMFCIPVYLYLIFALRSVIKGIKYTNALIWFVSFSIALFSTQVNLLLLCFLIVPFIIQKTRYELIELLLLLIPWKDVKWIRQLLLALQRLA